MDFEWDILGTTASGQTVVYKELRKMADRIRTRADARAAAAHDAELTRRLSSQHRVVVTILDAGGVKLRPVVYHYIKAAIAANPPRPMHTYVVNTPKWATRVYLAMRRLLSDDDVQSTSVHAGPYESLPLVISPRPVL